MVRSTFVKLTAACLISTIVPVITAASAAQRAVDMMNLFERAELTGRAELTCPISGYTPCNKNGLPGNFCCPSTSTCVAFNDGRSAICCPSGRDCSTIQPINCDLTRQNATAHPSSQLYTTDLTTNMESCGNQCCPQGYSCKNGQCTVSSGSLTASSAPSSAPTSSTSSTPIPSEAAASSKSSQSATSAARASSTASHSATPQAAATQAHCNQYPAPGILVGFFSGLAVGIILTILVICCFGHRRHRKENPPTTPDFSSVAANVSDPIYQPQQANTFRSDFLRRESNSKYTQRTSRVRSLFSRTPTMRSMRSREAPVDGIGRTIQPRTPVNQRSPEPSLKKEPSMESIKIYSPPNGGLGRPNTTFTDMMADAGFKTGEPYLGSPGRGMPMP